MDVSSVACQVREARSRRVIFEIISGLSTLSLVVVIECFCINQHRHNDLAYSTTKQVFQGNAVGQFGLSHVPELVLDIIHFEAILLSAFEFLNDASEKHVDSEGIKRAFLPHIQNPPEILNCLMSFLILHRQYKI